MPYVYHEYPKHVIVNGVTYTVQDEAEEAQVLSTGNLVTEEGERARMMKHAEVKGLKMDGRWSLERMRSTLSNAGYDPDFDPSK